jgi:hypothetical protein
MTCKNIVMVEGYYSAIERKTCALHVKCACVVMHIKTIRPCKFYFDYLSLQKLSISCNQVKIFAHWNLKCYSEGFKLIEFLELKAPEIL